MSPESIAGLTIPLDALADLNDALEELDLSPAVPHSLPVEVREAPARPAATIEREAA